jgi:hypothetical protein
VAEVGAGEVGDGGEIDEDGEIEFVGDFDGEVEGGIVEGALGALHPVDDALAVFRRDAGTADGDSWILGKGFESRGECSGEMVFGTMVRGSMGHGSRCFLG